MALQTRIPFADILRHQNYIAGQWLGQGTGETLPVRHKYTQELIAELPMATEAQMEQAMAAAEQGYQVMRKWSAEQRSNLLQTTAQLLEVQREWFAQLIVAEAGKPIEYARGEIQRCLITLRRSAEEALRFAGETVPIDFAAGTGRTALTRRFPIGPIAAIAPFNFPLNLALHKLAPALAVGNSIVMKPSPYAPLTLLAFAKLIEQAGYPAGAVSVLVCDIPVAELMVRDERMKMLSFTGSPKVGWHLKGIAGRKKVTLELGGNAAVIVDETADLAQTAQTVARGAYLYAGQICISTQRIYVLDAVYDDFLPLFVQAIEALHTGDPSEEQTTVGPIIDEQHLSRIAKWVNEARQEGALLLAGGKIIDLERRLYAPTLLTDTRPEMKVVGEEVFGPVAIIERMPDFQAALDATNHSQYGLQAGIFTNQFDHMKQAHEELEVGGVIINSIPGFRVDSMPYGGVKGSGFGREGIRYAMEDMTEPRLLVY
jgi:acyl-CoA reductase-like NAD-dependent aldehyde dehydrogenase